jgi:alpha-beta hydrolase superfamily lysophospholipase
VRLEEEFRAGARGAPSTFETTASSRTAVRRDAAKVLEDPNAADAFLLGRYHPGSVPERLALGTVHNHSYELTPATPPRGAVLLVHGLSDSPYSMRGIAQVFFDQGFDVVVLRLPGHGTIPGRCATSPGRTVRGGGARRALRRVAGRRGPSVLRRRALDRRRAPVALCRAGGGGRLLPRPERLFLVSPAIGISPFAVLTNIVSGLSFLPAFEKSQWIDVLPEYDPYKYNSFPVNAGNQIYALTHVLRKALEEASERKRLDRMPRFTIFQSLVDSTVTASEVVNGLLLRLPGTGNELVVFDLNRREEMEGLIAPGPTATLQKLRAAPTLAVPLTIVGNRADGSSAMGLFVRDPEPACPGVRARNARRTCRSSGRAASSPSATWPCRSRPTIGLRRRSARRREPRASPSAPSRPGARAGRSSCPSARSPACAAIPSSRSFAIASSRPWPRLRKAPQVALVEGVMTSERYGPMLAPFRNACPPIGGRFHEKDFARSRHRSPRGRAPVRGNAKPRTESGTVTVKTTIEAIDHAARTVTLKDKDGNYETLHAGPEIKRFDELKVGDKVSFKYTESVAVRIRKPGEPVTANSNGQPAIRPRRHREAERHDDGAGDRHRDRQGGGQEEQVDHLRRRGRPRRQRAGRGQEPGEGRAPGGQGRGDLHHGAAHRRRVETQVRPVASEFQRTGGRAMKNDPRIPSTIPFQWRRTRSSTSPRGRSPRLHPAHGRRRAAAVLTGKTTTEVEAATAAAAKRAAKPAPAKQPTTLSPNLNVVKKAKGP